MDPVLSSLNLTEQMLFITLKKVQHDRMEHQTAAANSDGRKSEDHRRKRAACRNKELILEEVLEKSGLYGVYRAWAYGK